MVRYLGDTVITMDAERRVLRPGALDVDADRIAWVGPPEERDAPVGAAVRWLGGIVMPGLVNTHAHSPMTLLRSAGDGLPLQRWLEEAIWPREAHLRPDDVYWGMTLGCEELLTGGVTTTCEMYLLDRALVDAAVDAGIRCVATPGIFGVADDDGRWQSFLDRAEELHSAADGLGGRISIGFGPHSAYALSPAGLAATVRAALEVDALVHVHVAENRQEVKTVTEAHGCGVPELLERLGVLDARCLAAHSVWLDDADLERYRRHAVAVAHCPGSNGKLASGVARLHDMLASGLAVGLGTDGPASNDDLDLWQELRLAPLFARATSGDAGAVTTEDSLHLATRGGADALGLEVGSLEIGRLADFIRLETDDPRMVPGVTDEELVAHVVWAGDRALVTDVWVGGRQLVTRGSCTTVDRRRAHREVRERAQRIRESEGS
jgi:5-methylthioadenosine/S-adenosylhomocysteine deaminase